jgi:ATP-dependent DNA helicase RecQ
MRAAAPARILLPSEAAPRRKGGSKETGGSRERKPINAMPAADLDDEGRRLFEALRVVRLALAKERGIPSYVVAHDRTLVELASARPTTREGLQGIHGLGPQRIETYGDALLAALVAAPG